ncbi:hypothetical protein GGTG_11946 [Gaeumannomyces tritici R3-111a-1]|uniref:Uncharacterized protein n=1 Tax=Gaeumannomyces tritici (strain R3-111a-1) TaxID=644352 RepID=J3PEL5_GAET3|nr:hypothetical protein GGTG_11946 [Gaeumannomyces tritici R3-111a-1]EJT70923.1 hypothetical protein GGTG_11946 [Gaeumannomyces tritici R3-111a-1]
MMIHNRGWWAHPRETTTCMCYLPSTAIHFPRLPRAMARPCRAPGADLEQPKHIDKDAVARGALTTSIGTASAITGRQTAKTEAM